MIYPPNAFQPTPRFLPLRPPKRKIFVSFHHENDQGAFNLLKHLFLDKYDVFEDHSLNRELIDSKISEYIDVAIREQFIKGTSVTIVLCGSETHGRKFVDWEINSTLLGKRALLGIILPSAVQDDLSKWVVPGRLHDNIQSGYAHYDFWENCCSSAEKLNEAIEIAIQNCKRTASLTNNRPKMQRNL